MLNNFKHGIVHGDLHPGNILFLKNNMIGYIDFGIVYKINVEQQNFLYIFFTNFINNEYKKLVDDLFDNETIHLYFNINDDILNNNNIELAKNEIINKINKNELFKDNNINNTDMLILIKILNKNNIEFNEFTSNILLTAVSGLGFILKLSNMKVNEKLFESFNKFKKTISHDIM
jgi:predicted unusual protein kinase regulating ubiquinone biosynthesis (AarF/ABC1/UbiB family)